MRGHRANTSNIKQHRGKNKIIRSRIRNNIISNNNISGQDKEKELNQLNKKKGMEMQKIRYRAAHITPRNENAGKKEESDYDMDIDA